MAGKNKNTGLGKGLEALFGEIEGSVGVGDGKTDNSSLEIDINEIKPNAGQPRKTFDKDALRELADSIRENGLIQPIIVRKSGSVYEIVAGERRWRACRLAGLEKIPCIVRELTDKELMLFAIIENMQRENLNPIEEAEGLASMMNSYGLTQLQISKSVGKSRPYIANSLRLLTLSSEVRALMQEGSLSGGHGKALLKISNEDKQLALAKRIVKDGLSVRAVEDITSEKDKPAKKQGRPANKNSDILAVEDELKEKLGTKVTLNLGAKKGKIEIKYYSRDELERLIELLKSL